MYSIFKHILVIVSFGIFPFLVPAQNIGINTTGASADASAILDLNTGNSGNMGFLAPQAALQSTTDVATIPTPATGLIVYNTNAGMTLGSGIGYYYYSGTQWNYFMSSGAPSGTVSSVGLIGPGGIFGITNTNGNPITSTGSFGITTTGTSGGIPYFNSNSTLASSALLTHYGIIYGGGAGGAPVSTAALTNGQLLIGSTGLAPVPANITAGSGISVTNGAGSISIATSGVVTSVTATAPVYSSGGTTPNITIGGTTNGVVYATGANSAAVTPASTAASQVLMTTAAGGAPTFQAMGSLNSIRVITASGNYSPLAGTSVIQVELIGAGGGGGSSSVGGSNGSAGGGGGCRWLCARFSL